MITTQKRTLSFSRILEPLSGFLRLLIPLAIGAGILFILDRTQRDTALTLAETRPIITVIAILLGGVALWGIARVVPLIIGQFRHFAWRMSLRSVGWIGLAGSIVGVALLLLSNDSDPKKFPLAGAERAVEFTVPLVVGMQAAFLFAPDDEPGIEVLLACPRPISWLLLERLLVLAALQITAALLGTAVSIFITGGQDIFPTVVRWISPALFFGGIGVYTTWRSRQPAFGIAVVGLLWFVFAFIGMVFMPGVPTFWPLKLIQPFLWSLHAYLQPSDLTGGDYGLNRIILGALGIILIMLTARQLRDEERILNGGKIGKASKGT